MRPQIVAGNWKMNGTTASIDTLLSNLLQGMAKQVPAEVVLFPPFPYINQVVKKLQGSAVRCGAQTLSANEPGAYTGEIAAEMLTDLGCRYVIVGHSERRSLYGEDNVTVAMKFAQAKKHGLSPILCLGETQQQRLAEQTEQVVAEQLQAILDLAEGVQGLTGAVLAYEPVWAIGTGMTATPEQAQAVHQLLRQQVAALDVSIADRLPILYGGSVKPDNAKAIFEMPDIDGGLIGGASLDGAQFVEIINSI